MAAALGRNTQHHSRTLARCVTVMKMSTVQRFGSGEPLTGSPGDGGAGGGDAHADAERHQLGIAAAVG